MALNTFKVHNLSYSRGDRDLFSDLSFSIHSQELLQIEGANGAGKTSLLKILAGLSVANNGFVTWNNIDIANNLYKKDLIYFGHQTGIKNELTALENLQLARQLKNNNQQDLWGILKNLSLAGFEDIPCFNLSVGQKRRVGLARLFVSNCPLWILDEPFVALDKSGVLYFESLCQQHLNKQGMIILTTHQPLKSLSGKSIILK